MTIELIYNDAMPPERPSFEVEVGKNKLIAAPEDPYGFWYVHYERGETPEDLSGSYTSQIEAQKAIEVYLQKRNKKNGTA